MPDPTSPTIAVSLPASALKLIFAREKAAFTSTGFLGSFFFVFLEDLLSASGSSALAIKSRVLDLPNAENAVNPQDRKGNKTKYHVNKLRKVY